MYTLLNKLFGWDYIVWHRGYRQGVSRVRSSGTGEPYYKEDDCGDICLVTSATKAIWLTCNPSKYGL